MLGFGFFIGLCLLIYFGFFNKKKPEKKPIDLTKDSKYYEREFPDLFKPIEEKKEKPNVTINVYQTHNHLHIHTKDEGSQENHYQDQ